MTEERKAGLFGLKNSNRDFSSKDNWGKNQFNSSFPAALTCYMGERKVKPVYLKMDNQYAVYKDYIEVSELFKVPVGVNPSDAYFEFEGIYKPHNEYDETLLRSDLVVKSIPADNAEDTYFSHHEVKLTTVPDSATFNKTEDKFGCEIVVRSVTIVHLAVNLIELYKDNKHDLATILNPVTSVISDWKDEKIILPLLPMMINVLNDILTQNIDKQSPLILNPIWKTNGKSSALADNCLDLFVWSDFAVTRLFINSINSSKKSIDRYSRSLVWLLYLLHQYTIRDKINSSEIYTMPFNSQTDKAFAVNGSKTNPYMACDELLNPRITREEIGNIIFNDGQLLLSPERRFDAAIYYASDIFEQEE
ncbi:HindVP family restriction endonuclease [Lysinibacillus capsici]|uniref:HindVP family restriction endonuclease n=1 Tax=Lysinibacillus capsici TaxID=2115968 RepID=UPI002DB620B0|nr:HindVP family restriction endonuclease [Lysinibacillus capsici]MEC1304300.1 HindVP family restriction endonuclease [Lysinibacillus capsici]